MIKELPYKEIHKRYLGGEKIKDLAEEYDVSHSMLYDHLFELGTRSISESKKGRLHPRWKGGRYIDKKGRPMLLINGKYVLESRYVWEQKHGPIPLGCVIHHRDENPSNNDDENLKLKQESLHKSDHTKIKIDIAALHKERRNGSTLKMLAEKHSCSRMTIIRKLRKHI